MIRISLNRHSSALFFCSCIVSAVSAGQQFAQAQTTTPVPDEATSNVQPSTPDSSSLPLVSGGAYDHQAGLASVTPAARQRIWSSSFAFGYGYDTAAEDEPGASAPFTLAEGVIGLAIKKRRYTLMLQHDAHFARYLSQGFGLQQYQQTGVSAAGFLSRVTRWTAQLDNGVGSDAARLIGNSVLNPVSQTQPGLLGSATALNQGLTLSDYGSFNVEHMLSPTVIAEARVGEYYHHFFQLGTSGQQQDLDLSLRRSWSPKLTSGLELSTSRQSYLSTTCFTGSVEAFASASLSHSVQIEGAGGPALTSSGCSGKYLANMLLSKRVARGASFYVGGARKPSDQFVAGSNWETSAFAGAVAGQARHLQDRFDAGYASYKVANPTIFTPNLHGFFVSNEIRHRLSTNAELSFDARFFSQSAGTSNLNRTIFLMNFAWSREQRPTRLAKSGGLHGDL